MPFDFFAPKEKFVVLEVLPTGIDGLFFSVDDDRRLIFEKKMEDVDLGKSFSSPALGIAQGHWEGQYFFKSRRKVIAIADARVATTIPVPLELRRELSAAKDSLSLSEFENLIAQAMAKIFNRCRAEAGARLKTSELDTILVRAKVGRIILDGHAALDPVGKVGKKMSLLLELTFTRRDTFEGLRKFFSSPEEFFFVESPQVQLAVLSGVHSLPLNLIAADQDGATSSLFILESTAAGYPVLYRESLAWHPDMPIQAIMESLDVPKSVAKDLYEAYREGKASATVARHFDKIIDPSVKTLLREVAKAKIKGSVYMDTPHALPFDLPHRSEGVVFEAAPLSELMEKLGFEGNLAEWQLPPSTLVRYLVPFFEAYFEKNNLEINRKLRRRLHWLAE